MRDRRLLPAAPAPTFVVVDPERGWQVIEQQRLLIADRLADLTPSQWETMSLCTAWRVRDVAAHLTLAADPPALPAMVAEVVRARGGFDRLNAALAIGRAARSTEQLVADLREHASSRTIPIVTNQRNLMLDVLVHSQDIALPLGRELPMPGDAVVASVDRAWVMGWPFWARRRLRGLRLSATDATWSAGAGAPVSGPARALLLLLTGRVAAALPELTGSGVGVLRKPVGAGRRR